MRLVGTVVSAHTGVTTICRGRSRVIVVMLAVRRQSDSCRMVVKTRKRRRRRWWWRRRATAAVSVVVVVAAAGAAAAHGANTSGVATISAEHAIVLLHEPMGVVACLHRARDLFPHRNEVLQSDRIRVELCLVCLRGQAVSIHVVDKEGRGHGCFAARVVVVVPMFVCSFVRSFFPSFRSVRCVCV